MKAVWFKIPIALAILGALIIPAPGGGEWERECRDVAIEIIGFAKARNIERISVLSFTAKGGAENNEAEYITESIAAHLAVRDKPALIERELLEKVLKETRLYSPPGDKGGMSNDIFSVDAVVTGTVFGSGDKLKILTKLIEVKTGRVLLASEVEVDREWPQFPDIPDGTFQWEGGSLRLPTPDLRDALTDTGTDCRTRQARAAELNSELVDAKARYWANKIKNPDFRLQDLTRNPGTEITDQNIKNKFYTLLKDYYYSDSPSPPDPVQFKKLLDLISEEARLANECR